MYKNIDMAGNSFGTLFKITTFGESHGVALGVVIDGCMAGIELDLGRIQRDLDRRKPGQSVITTQRKEADEFEVLSGLFEGKTTGMPISIAIRNTDQKSKDYSHIADKYRPSHADFTYDKKYGYRDFRGGGRSSARETSARVIAGAIAKQILEKFDIDILGYVSQVGDCKWAGTYQSVRAEDVEANIVRCPNQAKASEMIELIKNVKKQGDTIGGVVSCVIRGCPVGLGEPVFDKLHAELGKAMLSINAVKGFEYGSGFEGVKMKGSEHNDEFVTGDNDEIITMSNHSGGIQGGISNGMDIYFNVGFKPVATIMRDQKSVDKSGDEVIVSGKGRHDPCVVPRAVPIVEAMAALVIVDFLMIQKAREAMSV